MVFIMRTKLMKKAILSLLVLAVASVSAQAAIIGGGIGGNVVIVQDDNYLGALDQMELKPGNKVILDSRAEFIEITWASGCGGSAPVTTKFLGAQVVQITSQAPFCCQPGEVVSMVSDSSGNNYQQCTADWSSVAEGKQQQGGQGDGAGKAKGQGGGGAITVLTGTLLIGAGAGLAGGDDDTSQ